MKQFIVKVFAKDIVIPILTIKNIISIDFTKRGKPNLGELTSYGIVANTGSFKFIDDGRRYKTINRMAEDGIYEDIKYEIYLQGGSFERKMATFLLDDYDYNEETLEVDVSLKSPLLELQSKYISITVNRRTSLSSLYNYYSWLSHVGLPSGYIISGDKVRWGALNPDTMNRLQDIRVYYPKPHLSASLWEFMTWICEASMCNITEDENGRPILYRNDILKDVFVIRPRNILKIGQRIQNAKNKIRKAQLSVINSAEELGEIATLPFRVLEVSSTDGADNIDEITADQVWEESENEPLGLNFKIAQDTLELFEASPRGIPSNDAPLKVFSSKTVYRRLRLSNGIWKEEEISDYTDYHLITVDNEKNPPCIHISESNPLNLYNVYSRGYNYTILDGTLYVRGYRHVEYENVDVSAEVSGNDAESTILLENNDLMLIDNKWRDGENYAQGMVNEIVNLYKNGAECVEMTCLIADYYDKDGELKIDSSGTSGVIQTLERNDTIAPYVVRNGVEQPFSTKPDGTPKEFFVTGTAYSYHGIAKQTLYLQEITY